MNFITNTTNLSNWTLSLVMGVVAAFSSGSQGGIVGELPLSDTVLTIPRRVSNDKMPNLLISKRTKFANLVLNSFYSKRLEISHILLDDHYVAPCGCLCATVVDITPQMFYGLLSDDDGTITVHKGDCILSSKVHYRVYEFYPLALRDHVRDMCNRDAKEFSYKFIVALRDIVHNLKPLSNEWDTGITDRILALADDIMARSGRDTSLDSETVDRIFSRVGGMLVRLNIRELSVDGISVDANNVMFPITLYFGIVRTLEASDQIYAHNSIVVSGYNSKIGHEIMDDMSLVPSEQKMGYSERYIMESANSMRVVRRKIHDSIGLAILLLDVALSLAIMALSGLGPVLSMYASRRMTAPYRDSVLRMGTSLRWSVSDMTMLFTGSARDDWMLMIKPRSEVDRNIVLFATVPLLQTIGVWTAWVFFHPTITPISDMGLVITICGCVMCVTWAIACMTIAKQRTMDFVFCSVSPAILAVSMACGNELDWTYTYLFEAIYFALWLYGEITSSWMTESTGLFMLGLLGALRLTNLPK